MKLEDELKDVSHAQSLACQTKITDASKQEQESCPFVYSTRSTPGCEKVFMWKDGLSSVAVANSIQVRK